MVAVLDLVEPVLRAVTVFLVPAAGSVAVPTPASGERSLDLPGVGAGVVVPATVMSGRLIRPVVAKLATSSPTSDAGSRAKSSYVPVPWP